MNDRVSEQFGPYRVLRRLGSGAYGHVYEAIHVTSGHAVALKLFAPLEAAGFVREASVSLGKPHPNLVSGFSVGYGAAPWIALQLARGGSLRDRMQRTPQHRLQQREIRHVMLELLRGLHELHQRGIVHRDVKPENILFEDDSEMARAQIADYGGITTDVHRKAVAAFGSPAYAAPESQDGIATPASDVYSAAVIAFELLTGQRPFTGNPAEVLALHRDVTPCYDRINAVVTRALAPALAKDPNERPSTGRFAALLEHAFAEQRELRTQDYAALVAQDSRLDILSRAYAIRKDGHVEIRNGFGLIEKIRTKSACGLQVTLSSPTEVVIHEGTSVYVDGKNYPIEALPPGSGGPCAIRRFLGDAVAIVGNDRRTLVALPDGHTLCRFDMAVEAILCVLTTDGDEVVALGKHGLQVQVFSPARGMRTPAVSGSIAKVSHSLHQVSLACRSGQHIPLFSAA
jgi:serine/threonine protein kinase